MTCTCGGDIGQPADHHDLSCPLTLGPVEPSLWRQNGPTEQGICLIEIGDRISVELTGSLTNGVTDAEVQSVADLIMAAPAMLAELQLLRGENARLSTHVIGGILGELLDAAETEALVGFVKSLPSQATEVKPLPLSVIIEKAISHARKYDVREGDPRRRFTVAQMEIAIAQATGAA